MTRGSAEGLRRYGPIRSTLLGRLAITHEPGRVLLPVLTVELTALVLAGLLVVRADAPSRAQLQTALLLVMAGILHSEIVRGIERVRRRITDGNKVDLSSVWTFAAALLLPPLQAGTVAVVVHGYLWIRSWRMRTPLYRHVFSTTSVVLAAFAASATVNFAGTGGLAVGAGHNLLLVVAGLLVYTTVNSCLIAGVIAISAPRASLSDVFASWDDNVLEVATLCLGGCTAAAILINPWLVGFVLLPLLVLHRAALVRQLQDAADTDPKTGLLTAAAWHRRAERLMHSGGSDRSYCVLLCDLDYFKVVNDTHGHLAGDRVLTEIAAVLRHEIRGGDLVGRFGGEEFVLLLAGDPGEAPDLLESAAERIRRRVAALLVEISTPDGPLTIGGLTVSIGGVVAHASNPTELRDLMELADAAMYSAKRAGRNRVRLVPTPPDPTTTGAQALRPRAAS